MVFHCCYGISGGDETGLIFAVGVFAVYFVLGCGGLYYGIVALGQIKKHKEKGKWRAVTGMIFGGAPFCFLFVWYALGSLGML